MVMDSDMIRKVVLSLLLCVASLCTISCVKGGSISIFVKNDTDDTLYLSSALFQNTQYLPHSRNEIFSESEGNTYNKDYFMSVINKYKYLSIYIDTSCVAFWQTQSNFPQDSHDFFNIYSWDYSINIHDDDNYYTFTIIEEDLKQPLEE